MELTRRGDYSVRAVLDIARHHGSGRRKAREIAAAMDIPDPYVTQILAHLVRSGILDAVAGPDGGYTLVTEPGGVSLLDVVEAAEGPVGIEECILRGGPCDWSTVCPMHVTWSRAQTAFVDALGSTTFADLVATDLAISAGDYVPPPDVPFHPVPTERRGRRS